MNNVIQRSIEILEVRQGFRSDAQRKAVFAKRGKMKLGLPSGKGMKSSGSGNSVKDIGSALGVRLKEMKTGFGDPLFHGKMPENYHLKMKSAGWKKSGTSSNSNSDGWSETWKKGSSSVTLSGNSRTGKISVSPRG